MADRKVHPGFARNAKVIGIIIAAAAVIAVVMLVALHNRNNNDTPADIPEMSAKGGKHVAESPRYTSSLNQANSEALAQAQKTGATFIPALSDNNAQMQQALADRDTQAQVQPQPQKIDYQHPNGGGTVQQLPSLPPANAGVGPEVMQLVKDWDNPPGSQQVLNIQKDEQAANEAALAGAGASSALATAPKVPLMHANDKYYAHLENAIDSDAPSDSLAMLDQGPCKGGELRGTGKLTGEEVTASYSVLTCDGKTYAVAAEALNPDTLSNALPADIDHHVIAHVAVPALLGAIAAAGQVYSNAGASVTNSVLGGSTVVQNPNPQARQLEGAAAAGGVNGVQAVVQKEQAAIPAVTGTVAMNQAVIILFKADVASQ